MISQIPARHVANTRRCTLCFIFLAGCAPVPDILSGDPWCEEARHTVEPGESPAHSEPCWREGVVCTLRNAVHSTNLCLNPQRLSLRRDAEYLFDKADSDWASTRERRIVDRIGKRLTIEGNNATLRVAGGVADLWYFEVEPSASLDISDLTIVGSSRDACERGDNASGVYNAGTTVLRRVVFVDHDTCSTASAVYSTGSVTIESGTFRRNRGGATVAVMPLEVSEPTSRLTVTNTLFEANDGNSVISCSGSPCLVQRSTLVRNESAGSTIQARTTPVALQDLTLRSSTVSDNAALRVGGVEQFDGSVRIIDSTFADNAGSVASAFGSDCCGGLYIENSALSGSMATPTCEVLDGLFAPTNHGVATDASCGGLRRVATLGLSPVGDNGGRTPTRLPAATSPLIDTGRACLGNDQRGVTRPQGKACDVGAVEAR